MDRQNNTCNNEQIHKKGRHRKKQLYNTILNQMEFYFSDSNLTKDRFLGNLIKDNAFVNLDVFLLFNKIRKLTTNIEDIQKALRNSGLLQLSDDKISVCRKIPLKEKLNVDDCTIYIERLKSDVTHDWIKQIFNEFGNVVYVSLPKYKQNKTIKGFGFVEFDIENEAQEALNFFDKIGLKMPSHTDPEKLFSITTYEGNPDQSTIINKKIKFHDSVLDDNKEINNKKIKLNDSNLIEEDNDKKKKKIKKKEQFFKEIGIQVLSKKEWKKLRNRYLELQRKKMKEFKQHIINESKNQKNKNQLFNVSKLKNSREIYTKSIKKFSLSTSITSSVHNDNLEYIPGIIVKIQLNDNQQDQKKIKADIKASFPNIKFIDTHLYLTNNIIYIRLNNNESANNFLKLNGFGKKTILEGDEEKNYWKKIKSDREIKINRETKKQRGRNKLLNKANKVKTSIHIKFDD